eukprot:COSAG05_NODE_1639_length_4360_cov_2.033795_5_plen_106_part_00
MFAPKMAFDEVNMCEACRRYWWAIEMLTCKHGTITGQSEGVAIAEAISLQEIHESTSHMRLKTQIMLTVDRAMTVPDVDSGEGGADVEEEHQLGVPVVPIVEANS